MKRIAALSVCLLPMFGCVIRELPPQNPGPQPYAPRPVAAPLPPPPPNVAPPPTTPTAVPPPVTPGPVAAPSACRWVDGQDAASPSDPGRGVADWRSHQAFVLGGGVATAHNLINGRFVALRGCLDKDTVARVYADAAILIAHYGRTHAAWRDGSDPSAPPGDGGRGISRWEAHYEWAQGAAATTMSSKIIGDRLQALSSKLSKELYAHVYADVAVLLANSARMETTEPKAPAAAVTCRWVDGKDATVPGDGGRGIADWTAHFATGMNGANTYTFAGSRFVALGDCLDKASLARAYADASILIGHYGRSLAGWRDANDPTAPPGDGGRGLASWRAHYEYALNNAGSARFIQERVQTLGTKLPKDAYGRLYADLSILFANYGRRAN